MQFNSLGGTPDIITYRTSLPECSYTLTN